MIGATTRTHVTVDAAALDRGARHGGARTEQPEPGGAGGGHPGAWRREAVLSRPAVGRRVAALAAIGALAVLLVAASRVGARADLDRPLIGGTVTVAPGDTLWEVAVVHAPEGTDPRDYLARLRAVNGFHGAEVRAWTVVLLPAP